MNYHSYGWLARVLAACAVVVAFSTLVGYAINAPMFYRWTGPAVMAINTAVCLILLASAVTLLSLRRP